MPETGPLALPSRGQPRQQHWVHGTVPKYLPEVLHRSPLIEASAKAALFRLPGIGRFLVRPHVVVFVEASDGATEEDIECIFSGPVVALRSCLEGQFCMRGTAVELRGRAVLVLGGATGASSLAAALALGGGRVLADGVVCISGDPPEVWPPIGSATGRLTLWPPTVEALCLDPAQASTLRPVLPSRVFALGAQPPRVPVPLGALVFPSPDPRLGDRDPLVVAEDMAVRFSVSALRDAVWHSRVWEDLGGQQDQFELLTQMASAVPLLCLRRAFSPIAETLKEMARLIEAMFP